MSKKLKYHYFVEGEDEECLINVLKSDIQCIQTGKVHVFNVIQNRFTKLRVRNFSMNTVAIFVFDTDVETNLDILRANIEFLSKQKCIKEVICIPQIRYLEDELIRACRIKKVTEITNSQSLKNFKTDLIGCSDLDKRLLKCGFDVSKFWSSSAKNCFSEFENNANKIILKNR